MDGMVDGWSDGKNENASHHLTNNICEMKSFWLVILVGYYLNTAGQKHYYIWLSGYDSYVGFDTNGGFYFGTSVLDFNYNPRQVRYDSLGMNFGSTNASYCNPASNFSSQVFISCLVFFVFIFFLTL